MKLDYSLDEITLSLDDGLDPGPDAGVGPRHHGRESVNVGLLHGRHSVVGGPGDVPLTCPIFVVVQGVAVRAAQGPHLLPSEVRQFVAQPGLGHLGIVGRGAVLLEDVRAPPGHLIDPGLDNIPHHVNIHLGIYTEAPLEEVGGP